MLDEQGEIGTAAADSLQQSEQSLHDRVGGGDRAALFGCHGEQPRNQLVESIARQRRQLQVATTAAHPTKRFDERRRLIEASSGEVGYGVRAGRWVIP